MRCAPVLIVLLACAGFVCAGFSPAAVAQVDSPEARQLRAQLEDVQRRLEDLTRRDQSDQRVTEIGSSSGRPRDNAAPRLVVRIYDLSDLYAIAPTYPAFESGQLQEQLRPIFPASSLEGSATGGMGGMGGGMGSGGVGGFFSVPDSIRPAQKHTEPLRQMSQGVAGAQVSSLRSSIDSLIETITATIAPEDWNNQGGPASITSLGASLVVSAPVEMHDKIGALLDLFRKRWGTLRTISLQANWLWLSPDQLNAALALPQDKGQPQAFGALSDAAWKQLQEQAAGAEARSGYHAVLTCYNGQTVHALAGGQRLIVAGMIPVVGGGENAAAYQPQTRAIQDGAALQVTPVATRTAKFVVVDVHSRVNLLGPGKPVAPAADARPGVGEVVAALDRTELATQTLSTTLRIPAGRPMLIGGMTFDRPGGKNLYLFLTAHVQELRDEEGAELKAEDTKPVKPDDSKPANPSDSKPAKPDDPNRANQSQGLPSQSQSRSP